MAIDAIRGYLESLAKHGEEIPIESPNVIQEKVSISLPLTA